MAMYRTIAQNWSHYYAKLERHFVIVLYTNMAVSPPDWKPRIGRGPGSHFRKHCSYIWGTERAAFIFTYIAENDTIFRWRHFHICLKKDDIEETVKKKTKKELKVIRKTMLLMIECDRRKNEYLEQLRRNLQWQAVMQFRYTTLQ